MLVHVSSYSACLQLINHFLSCSCSCPFFKRTLQWAKIKMWGQGSGQGWFHTNHSILSIPASFPEGDGLIRIEVRLCTSFFKLCNALLHGRETYTYYWKKQTNKQTNKKTRNTDLCNYMMTYKTTDKTDHYMEYLRFSLRLKLLSYLHSFVLSTKRKRGKGGWFNFSGRVCVTKRLARG